MIVDNDASISFQTLNKCVRTHIVNAPPTNPTPNWLDGLTTLKTFVQGLFFFFSRQSQVVVNLPDLPHRPCFQGASSSGTHQLYAIYNCYSNISQYDLTPTSGLRTGRGDCVKGPLVKLRYPHRLSLWSTRLPLQTNFGYVPGHCQ